MFLFFLLLWIITDTYDCYYCYHNLLSLLLLLSFKLLLLLSHRLWRGSATCQGGGTGLEPRWCRMSPVRPGPALVRGWRNTVGNLIEFFWLKKAYHWPQFFLYMREAQRRTVSSNARCQAVLLQQYSANLSVGCKRIPRAAAALHGRRRGRTRAPGRAHTPPPIWGIY